MRVFLLYEGRRRDNAVDGRWNIDESARGPLPARPLSASAWSADLAHEFYAVILREWVRLGWVEQAIIVAIPSTDPASRRFAPFGVYDLGGGVSACLIPSAAALNDTFPPGPEDLLWVRGPYAYWDVVRRSRAWQSTVYYSANGKALRPGYPVDAVLVDHPEMAVPGAPAVLFDKTCDTSVFRPLASPKSFDVLVPGALSGKKGQAALARVLPPDLEVVFAGDTHDLKTGSERPEAAEIRRLLPRARLIGHVSHAEMNRLYNEARVTVVFSSVDDPAPRVLVESLAAGTPVVMAADMRFSARYAAPGAIERASRLRPLFRRALRRSLAAPAAAARAFNERYAPAVAAERLWLGLQSVLRRPAGVRVEDGWVVLDQDGEPAERFPVRDDLVDADAMLRQLNALRGPDGRRVHETAPVAGRPSWSWHQYELWWSWVRPYVRYRAAIDALRERGAVVRLDASAAELGPLLTAHGMTVEGWAPRRPSATASAWASAARLAAAAASALAVARARLLRLRTLVSTRDQFDPRHGCDARFREVYQALAGFGLEHTEVFPARAGRPLLSKLFARRRPAVYALFDHETPAAPEHEYHGWDAASLQGVSPLFVRSLLEFVAGRVTASRRRYELLRGALKLARFRTLVALDDPWHGNELLAAAKDCGMRTIGIQHGMLGRFHAGWMNPGIPREHGLAYDTYLVWSGYWKRAVERHSTQYGPGAVTVGGPLRPTPEDWRPAGACGSAVLVPYETLAPHPEVAEHVRRLQSGGLDVIFKARGDVPVLRQLKDYGLEPSLTRVVFDLNAAVLADVAVTVGVYTTVLWDMIRVGRAVAVLETSFPYGHLLLDDGLAVPFRRGDPVAELLRVSPVPGARQRLSEEEPRLRDTLRRLLLDEPVDAPATPSRSRA